MSLLITEAVADVRCGRFDFLAAGRMRDLLVGLEGQRVNVVLERPEPHRSIQQNRWYWSVIVPTVGQYLSKGRPFDLHPDQTHYLLKSAFLGVEETPLGVVPKSTKTLSVREFSEYTERIVAHAASEWGLPIGQPEEVGP